MCPCRHHSDRSAPCTCTCPHGHHSRVGSSPVRPRWLAPETDYATNFDVGDEVTLVVKARVVRKKPQSAGFPTILTLLPLGGGPDTETLRVWPGVEWRTTLDDPNTLTMLDGNEPLITLRKESRR